MATSSCRGHVCVESLIVQCFFPILLVSIGSACRSELHSRWRCWHTVHCMAMHHHTWRHHSPVADMPHRHRLRSASTERLDVPTCRRSTVRGRAFPVAGAKVWNSLPSDVTSASLLSVFKNRLKMHLFRRCYKTVWLWMTLSFPSNFILSSTVALAIVLAI